MFALDQPSLFGLAEPVPDHTFATLARYDLDHGAHLEVAPGWLAGDDVLYDHLASTVEWTQPEVVMYDKLVRTPRLVGPVDPDAHPAIGRMIELLSDRYGVRLDQVSAGWYRTGADSVAWHGDRVARDLPVSTVATVSLRGPRSFRYRPRDGGPSRSLALGRGDLVVMGGSFQRTWEHSVPKVASAPPRMAVMFRHRYH